MLLKMDLKIPYYHNLCPLSFVPRPSFLFPSKFLRCLFFSLASVRICQRARRPGWHQQPVRSAWLLPCLWFRISALYQSLPWPNRSAWLLPCSWLRILVRSQVCTAWPPFNNLRRSRRPSSLVLRPSSFGPCVLNLPLSLPSQQAGGRSAAHPRRGEG